MYGDEFAELARPGAYAGLSGVQGANRGTRCYQRIAEAIVADWRAAASDLLTVDEGTTEASELQAEVERLRDEYQRLVEEAYENDRPGPPAFLTIAEAESD